MKKSDYGILFMVALAFFSLIATLQQVPGYMDAEYYFGQGIRLVEHKDLVEPFIWNYLNNPLSVSSPGFAFWLPGTSIFAAAGLWITQTNSFFAARVVFILMAACLPIMAAFFAARFIDRRRAGWLAGLLALFSGFYLPYITITDTFTPYMFLGGLFFMSMWFAEKRSSNSEQGNYWFIVTGFIAGLMSLTRSDGILWLAGGMIGILFISGIKTTHWKKLVINFCFILGGFAIIMTPWYLRNYAIYDSLFPSGNNLMIWLTKYDDIFVYPSTSLTISNWISTGVENIVLDRFKALGSNLQTFIASGGVIFLAPIMVIGYWKQKQATVIRLVMVMLFAILAAMTVVFPYAGERGGFFHSLSALQIILWSLVPVGLYSIIQWGMKHRNWKSERSWKMFGTALVVVAGIFSSLIFFEKLNNGTESGIPWNQTQNDFLSIESKLVEMTKDHDGVIMVNNPPGYTLATGRPSVMIPSGGEEALMEISKRYDVHFWAINAERADVLALIDKNDLLSEHYDFLFESMGNRIYEFKP